MVNFMLFLKSIVEIIFFTKVCSHPITELTSCAGLLESQVWGVKARAGFVLTAGPT